MNRAEKDQARVILRAYSGRLEDACASKDLRRAEMIRQQIWGAVYLAEQLKVLTPAMALKMDVWADDMIFALRREYYTAGGEEIPCRERT